MFEGDCHADSGGCVAIVRAPSGMAGIEVIRTEPCSIEKKLSD